MNPSIPTFLAITLVLGACSSTPKQADDPGPSPAPAVVSVDNPDKGSADELYLKAKGLLNRKQYESAVMDLENLEATYPFSDHAAQARLDIAYANYRLKDFDSATAAADRFLKLYPQSDQADYAYYIKGLSNFSRGKSLFESLVPRKLYRLDQSALRNSFSDFSTLITKYPDSSYAEDCRARMTLLRNEMARHELSTAEYYFERSAMVAVINRVNAMLETYPDSTHTGNALSLMARAYIALGNRTLAAETVKALEAKEPKHPDLRIFSSIRS